MFVLAWILQESKIYENGHAWVVYLETWSQGIRVIEEKREGPYKDITMGD